MPSYIHECVTCFRQRVRVLCIMFGIQPLFFQPRIRPSLPPSFASILHSPSSLPTIVATCYLLLSNRHRQMPRLDILPPCLYRHRGRNLPVLPRSFQNFNSTMDHRVRRGCQVVGAGPCRGQGVGGWGLISEGMASDAAAMLTSRGFC